MSSLSKLRATAAVTAICCCALLVPAGASAATVVNGDFETGTLAGWTTHYATNNGVWLVYPKEPGEGIFTPPSGNWAAVDEEGNPDTPILYQDIALEPYDTHTLTMTLFYESEAPIFVPTPNTLFVNPLSSLPHNQQLRVDVVKPTAPIESLEPSDILATVFANKTGDPEVMGATKFTADLSPFAGQTVRLRIANAVHDAPFYAGVDAVSIASTPPINTFTQGKLKKGNGSATLEVTVPGPGTVSLVSLVNQGKPKPIKATTKNPALPGTIKLPLKATGSGHKTLKETGKLNFSVLITYTPTGGTATTQTRTGKLKLKLKR